MMACSRQQEYLYNLFGGKLNYPVDNCCLDIAFPLKKIYVEYDGSGHRLSVQLGDMTDKEFDRKEMQRKYFLKSLGWKEIRIISRNDLLPSDDVLLDMLKRGLVYLENEYSWIKYDIDNSKKITSQFEREFRFGKLRKVA